MKIARGKTYEGPTDSEWNMTVLLIDNEEAICLPSRPGGIGEAPFVIKWQSLNDIQIPAIESIPLRQFATWATRCINE
ncbi:hypothetical protein [Geothrix fuzhouensis]|uniref:hypothetical protein n=1 Tax=Geothrix fuzhouensis TaxID=2966451 RepID=UPI002148DBD6|nr:hypothetical protein [Geothrix fuzhouensis]